MMHRPAILLIIAATGPLAFLACSDETGSGTGGQGGAGGDDTGGTTTSANSTSTTTSGNGTTTASSTTVGSGGGSTGEGGSTNGSGGGTGGGGDCEPGDFVCSDGTCIIAEYECDKYEDCEDASDEWPVNAACPEVLPPPPGWTCAPEYYGDMECDCGCGVIDSDCADATVASCQYCADRGSCSTEECPGTINPADNAICN
jgi:hypothetical protein